MHYKWKKFGENQAFWVWWLFGFGSGAGGVAGSIATQQTSKPNTSIQRTRATKRFRACS